MNRRFNFGFGIAAVIACATGLLGIAFPAKQSPRVTPEVTTVIDVSSSEETSPVAENIDNDELLRFAIERYPIGDCSCGEQNTPLMCPNCAKTRPRQTLSRSWEEYGLELVENYPKGTCLCGETEEVLMCQGCGWNISTARAEFRIEDLPIELRSKFKGSDGVAVVRGYKKRVNPDGGPAKPMKIQLKRLK